MLSNSAPAVPAERQPAVARRAHRARPTSPGMQRGYTATWPPGSTATTGTGNGA